MTDDLATFDDALTMRHTRVFPHPIELVWEAVSQGEHLETWLLPVSRVDSRLGGDFLFTWGSPEGTEGQTPGTIDEFDPKSGTAEFKACAVKVEKAFARHAQMRATTAVVKVAH